LLPCLLKNSVPSYSNWEQGRALPPLAQIPVLAGFFGVSADYLLGISKQDATERLVERMQSLPEKSQRIVLALIEDMLEKNAPVLLKKVFIFVLSMY
jgi:transcriptional regulator with XRE-family HTH domain